MQETFYCDNCGTALEDRSCKLVCPKCHFFYSCSDYIYPPEPVTSRPAKEIPPPATDLSGRRAEKTPTEGCKVYDVDTKATR